ncbi:response regulator receiver sensor signal transduction histidine kinase [Desulfuromusa kysingii]|uniref:histidine kinase n=1 Tax=Desulfuromusa kysingii TaxID=37625 RepID=A0A1H4BFI0_9BACT|nr:hybrid sensor histidine kinase/response regulator [Desulfuromusa kysingii]SEA46901.1 response regulator receiver sensor signal transduction histidine kinase [Desulfuromusa kysingii]
MLLHHNPFAGEKIVIADDDETIVKLTSFLLAKIGFQVLSAENGYQCLQQVEEHHPALVLLDYMMPVMNGLEALKKIRSQFPDTYVLVFTGKGSEEVAVDLMKAGAADYLRKPFASHSLKERIYTVLSLRKTEIENRNLLKEREILQAEIQRWNLKLEDRVREKSSELEQAHKEIVQAEKLATLGHISAGMAHEIRNPLNSINLFAQILLSSEGIDAENKSYVSKITQEVERIDDILVQMLASSPDNKKTQQQIDLVVVLEKVLSECQLKIDKQKVVVELDVNQKLPEFYADFLEMEQIFTNLITNALYEMPDGGTLTISLQADAENIYARVSDTGSGIPDENIMRIFDPFFTTKKKGTGFGLSVVLRIVNSYGGKIHVENLPDSGVCFFIELPLFPQLVH